MPPPTYISHSFCLFLWIHAREVGNTSQGVFLAISSGEVRHMLFFSKAAFWRVLLLSNYVSMADSSTYNISLNDKEFVVLA